MKQFTRGIAALALAGVCAVAGATPREAAPAGFAPARQQFLAGLAGDGAARDAAAAAFQALAASHPGHPLLAAYAGAALALRGRDALMPWNKMKYAEQGADAIEKALAQLTPAHDEALFAGTPESIETRLVAATALSGLPAFMQRGPGARRAAEAALASPVWGAAAPAVRARLLEAAARMAARDGRASDEAGLLRQVLANAPRSAEAGRAAARLRELGQ